MKITLPVRLYSNRVGVAQAGARLQYMPGLDGLRAIAVIAVLLYHADLEAFPGGFLGVEVFFVVSGYLITALLLAEWRASGRVSLGAFWLRRARRLLPALFVLLAAVLAFAVLLLPDEVASLRRDTLATAGYVTNWHLIAQQRSYFEVVGRPPLLQHLWSLAVEEQFYLIWPLLFGLGIRADRRGLLALALLGAAGSAGLMAAQFHPDLDPSRLYYGTDTRATGLLLGAALALAWPHDQARDHAWPLSGLGGDLLGLGAIGLLIYWFMAVNEFQAFTYQGGLLCVGLATAVAIAAVSRPGGGLLARALGCAPLRWAGLRSYSLYLWHWPVFMVTRPQLDIALEGLPLLALRLALAAGLAELSYRLVEQPFRQGLLRQAWRRFSSAQGARRRQLAARWLASAAIVAALCLLVGRAVVNAQPPAPPEYLAEAAPAPAEAGLDPADLADLAEPLEPSATPDEPPAAALATSPTPQLELGGGFATEMPTIMAQARGPGLGEPATPTAAPSPTPTPAVPISAVGDSVMAGAVTQLTAALPQIQIDAQRGRQASAVIKVLQARRDAGQLGQVVVLHTGNNGGFSAAQFDTIMEILADVPHVIVVNVKVPRRWEAPNNRVIAEGAQRYSQVLLVDWRAATINRPELFWRDGIHLRPKGAELYAQMLGAAVQQVLAMP